MKKFTIVLMAAILLISSALFAGCKSAKKPNEGGGEEDAKILTGIGAMFDEPVGWKNENASVVCFSDMERYVFYTRSTEAYSQKTSIAVRKGTLQEGIWKWGDATTVLSPAEGWESAHVYAPSVVKGNFIYQGKNYSWLMAYSANANEGDLLGSQIGFALAESIDGTYVRLGAPAVTYTPSEYSEEGFASMGVNEPSLVSFDENGKVWLFYTYNGNNTTVGSRFIEFDLSGDLSGFAARPGWTGNAITSQFEGVETTNISPRAADYAYDKENDIFVSIRNTSPYGTSEPSEATGLQIVYGAADLLYGVPAGGWTLARNVNALMTVDMTDPSRYDGYARIYSGGLVRDEYGRISGETVEFTFTSKPLAAENEKYDFSSAIHLLSTEVTREMQ